MTNIVKLNLKTEFLQMKKELTLGELIREARNRKGLLLRHVGAELDVDTAILSKIERNERRATREQIIKLAEILDLDKEELLIKYLTEKILYQVRGEELGLEALKVAEERVKYNSKKRNK